MEHGFTLSYRLVGLGVLYFFWVAIYRVIHFFRYSTLSWKEFRLLITAGPHQVRLGRVRWRSAAGWQRVGGTVTYGRRLDSPINPTINLLSSSPPGGAAPAS